MRDLTVEELGHVYGGNGCGNNPQTNPSYSNNTNSHHRNTNAQKAANNTRPQNTKYN